MRFVEDTQKNKDSTYKGGPKVLALGLPRCATSSLQAALENQLGFSPCAHMAYVLPFVDRVKLVHDAIREKDKAKRQKMIKPLFDGYQATTDFPGMAFSEDLMEMYPDAKIVLNQRESAEKWHKSINDTLSIFASRWYWLACYWISTDYWHFQCHQAMIDNLCPKYGIPNVFVLEAYEAHRQLVLNTAKQNGREVLEWKVTEGWGPLCEFLDVPVPDSEFPHMNDTKELKKLTKILILRGIAAWVGVIGTASLCIWGLKSYVL